MKKLPLLEAFILFVINHYCFLCYSVISTVRMNSYFEYSDERTDKFCGCEGMAMGVGLEYWKHLDIDLKIRCLGYLSLIINL